MIVAHAGHWLANMLYALPVVVIGGLLGWQSLKDRLARRRADRSPEPPPPAADAGRGSGHRS